MATPPTATKYVKKASKLECYKHVLIVLWHSNIGHTIDFIKKKLHNRETDKILKHCTKDILKS